MTSENPAGATPNRSYLCRNCGAVAPGRYCTDCGQSTEEHMPSLWEFVHELVSHYVAAEGKLWRTLALLVVQPGRLTTEYLDGRRQRYIIPFRLYLTASFLFFAAAQWDSHFFGVDAGNVKVVTVNAAGDKSTAKVDVDVDDDQGGSVIRFKAPEGKSLDDLRAAHFEKCLEPQGNCSWYRRAIAPAMIQLQADPNHFLERFAERFRHSLSYAMFLLLPCFAALLALAYRGRHMYYGEHLIFALHVHSFWFLLALVAMVLPWDMDVLLPLGYAGYGLWALHRVYGGRWIPTLLRALFVTTCYALAMGVAATALSTYLLAT